MNDSRIINATKNMVRVLIRRPHAYKFRRDHPNAGIPCLAILNGKGRLLGGAKIPSADAVEQLLTVVKRHEKKRKTI